MPERDGYAPGTPSWVDLTSPSPEDSATFYRGLFGWEHQLAGPPDEVGGYGFFLKDGKMVAGVGPRQNDQQPVTWTSYVSTADAAETARKVTAAGGQTMLEPFAVMDVGHMGVFIDPTGAAFAVWQPERHKGAELVNEHGALTWNELHTGDVEAATAFYTSVFGWEAEPNELGPGFTYTSWKLDGAPIGGMMAMSPETDADAPPHWLVYFGSDDTDASVSRVVELGGSVTMGPVTAAPGRFAAFRDPHGSAFGVFQSAA